MFIFYSVKTCAKNNSCCNKNVPIKKLPKSFLDKILYGTGTENIDFQFESAAGIRKFSSPFEGVIPTFAEQTTAPAANQENQIIVLKGVFVDNTVFV